MVCCEKKENVDVDWNQLGEVNSYLKDFASVQYISMEVWYGILNQQITDRGGNFVYSYSS